MSETKHDDGGPRRERRNMANHLPAFRAANELVDWVIGNAERCSPSDLAAVQAVRRAIIVAMETAAAQAETGPK